MPDTTLGITYPTLTSTVQPAADMQALAEDVDTLITADRAKRDANLSTWTPSITGSTSGTWTAGASTLNATYFRLGRLVWAWMDIALGSGVSVSGAITGSMLVSVPVAMKGGIPSHVGTGILLDASTSGRWVVVAEYNNTATVVLVRADTGGIIGNQTPAAANWASGDSFRLQLCYETGSVA